MFKYSKEKHVAPSISTINNKYLHLVYIVNFWLRFMARNWGVKAVPAGGWNITGVLKLDTVSHTSNLHSWELQDTNQVLCNKKALQCVTKETTACQVFSSSVKDRHELGVGWGSRVIYQYQSSKMQTGYRSRMPTNPGQQWQKEGVQSVQGFSSQQESGLLKTKMTLFHSC